MIILQKHIAASVARSQQTPQVFTECSIDFVPDKGDEKITVRVEKNNTNNVTLTVEDNGIGIKPEKADNLFQKFYQIDTGATSRHGDTGREGEAHGGKI